MLRNSISENLFKEMRSLVNSYPANRVCPVGRPLDGIVAFFPGGSGLLRDHDNIIPDVMVLGQDFGTFDDFSRMSSMSRSQERKSPTWINFESLAYQVGLSLERCFFTNVIMGLRMIGKSTGLNLGLKDVNFKNQNIQFLKRQIELINPKIVIVLGAIPAQLISEISNDLRIWKDFKFKKVDENRKAQIRIVRLKDGSQGFTCVVIVHPSFRNFHVKRRKYKNYEGNCAEVQLLKEAIKALIP